MDPTSRQKRKTDAKDAEEVISEMKCSSPCTKKKAKKDPKEEEEDDEEERGTPLLCCHQAAAETLSGRSREPPPLMVQAEQAIEAGHTGPSPPHTADHCVRAREALPAP